MNRVNPATASVVEAYYASHRDELLAFVSSRLYTSTPHLRGGGVSGGGEDAEDIVQNVFLRLLTADRLITEITLPAFVYTIARNLISDYYRRHHSLEDYEHYLKSTDETAGSAESVLSIREITEQLERGLARVPENCREVYRMHIYGGMKVAEISARLGEGYKSVEHRLGTARKAVRHALLRYA